MGTQTVAAYAAPEPGAPLAPTVITRRATGPHDVRIRIAYAGICHSDIHMARGDWGGADRFPLVPGHEITGIVSEIGPEVTRHAVGDRVGVGCFVDSCRTCANCHAGEEQYCLAGETPTYGGRDRDGTRTHGGYSGSVVVDENYVLSIPDRLGLDEAAPLLCAGITMYSPLLRHGAGPGCRVGVVGLGGLGHMGVKLAAAMGADVTVLSHSERKRDDALRLGALSFRTTADHSVFKELAGSLDLVLNTVSADIDLTRHLGLLALDGTMVCVGAPEAPSPVHAFALITHRRSLTGSKIGGIRETQEMLDFCAEHRLGADIEVVAAHEVNQAYERVLAGDVRFRFVIDAASLQN